MKKVKEFKIEFIEKPDLFAKNELESIKGGLAETCFIEGCTCKAGKLVCTCYSAKVINNV